jgi:hypothetical protein
MPWRESHASRGNLFYSFDISSLLHVIFLTPYLPTYPGSAQYTWLKQDLHAIKKHSTKAGTTNVPPWIIVVMHAPWYNSNMAHQNHHEPQHVMKKDMETLFFDARVSLVMAGHVHAYERSLPVYQEKVHADGPVYVVIGDGGNREDIASSYVEPAPHWSAFRRARYEDRS